MVTLADRAGRHGGGAKALALTALDLLAAPDKLKAAKEDFKR